MLVLTGKKDESIICTLGDRREIAITLLEHSANQARIGVNAGEAIEVLRNELLNTDLALPKLS